MGFPTIWVGSEIKGEIPLCAFRCPGTGQFYGDALYLLYMAAGRARDSLDDALRPTWLSNTVHEGCDRGGFYEQAQFADEYGSPLCIVKLDVGTVSSAMSGNEADGWIGGCPMSVDLRWRTSPASR